MRKIGEGHVRKGPIVFLHWEEVESEPRFSSERVTTSSIVIYPSKYF